VLVGRSYLEVQVSDEMGVATGERAHVFGISMVLKPIHGQLSGDVPRIMKKGRHCRVGNEAYPSVRFNKESPCKLA
jgi:hypothetical protein